MGHNPTKCEIIESAALTAVTRPAEPTEPELEMEKEEEAKTTAETEDDENSSCTSGDYDSAGSDIFLYAIHPKKEISELVDILNTSQGFTLDGYRESHMKFNHRYSVISVGRFDSKRITLTLDDDEDQFNNHCLYAVIKFTTKTREEIFRITEMFKQLFLPHKLRFDKIQVSFEQQPQGSYEAPKIKFSSDY